ncbi:MAG: glycosyltransferase [Pisciglobus halotolerans]|nr:glycosyltransferase [Pisciglobus halotolerans]
MRYKKIAFISPPFYSHLKPLLTLAKSFRKQGTEVFFGCSSEFEEEIIAAGLTFYEINVNANRNTGGAEQTDQPDSEAERLGEFFEATTKGAVETLIVQSKHRKADMLHKPDEMIERLSEINTTYSPDVYVVDIYPME